MNTSLQSTLRSHASTRIGTVRELYSELVERRPYSRFTSNPVEIAANEAWQDRAEEWGNDKVDAHGNLTKDIELCQ